MPRHLMRSVRLRRSLGFVVLASLLAAGVGGRFARAADRAAALGEAFKPLRLPPAARLEKEVVAALPGGIVIEAKPFHDLVRRFSAPADAVLDARDAAVEALGGAPTRAEAQALVAGLRALDAEVEDLRARVAATEARYAEVYNLEWDAAGDKERTTRKLAAVVIPLCRRLLAREAATASAAARALSGTEAGARRALLDALASDASPGLRAVAVEALGTGTGAEDLATLRRLLASDPEAPVRLRALAATLRWKVAEVRGTVVAALGDAAWEVRALAAAACARARLVEAAGALVGALGKEDGRLRQDLDDALFALLGVRMQGDAALWRKWLAENQAAVAAKAEALEREGAYDVVLGPPEAWEPPADAAAEDAKGSTSAFYGIRTPSRRVVFVVDVSRSMQDDAQEKPPPEGGPKDPYREPKGGSKLAIAKWQLHRAIAALPADATFGVVVFSESYRAWQPDMTEASAKGKGKAHDFVDGIVANGTTNVADALDRALELAGALPLPVRGKAPRAFLAADTVFLLSDGDPNRGRVTDLAALEDELVRRARAHRLVVHTVGIGEVAGSSFLSSLARRTGGRYVGFR